MTKKNFPRKPERIMKKKRDSQNCSKLAFFTLFQISNPNIFVIFGFLHPNFFFETTNLLLFSQKNFDTCAINLATIMDILGGGGKFHVKFTPPRNEMSDFVDIVVKRDLKDYINSDSKHN